MFTGKHLCWSFFLIKLQALILQFYLKKLQHRCFPVNTFFNRTHPVATSGNISWTLSLLHMRTMRGVISWTLALQCLFHFIVRVSFLSISFLFSYVFVDSTTWWGIELRLSIPKIKQWSCSKVPQWSFEGWVASALFSN